MRHNFRQELDLPRELQNREKIETSAKLTLFLYKLFYTNNCNTNHVKKECKQYIKYVGLQVHFIGDTLVVCTKSSI